MAQWSHTDLSQAATAPAGASQLFGDLSRPMGCVRFNRTNVVLFTGNDGHIHQLHLSGATWVHSDLSALGGAPDSKSRTSPMVCVRPDGVLSVAYTAQDQHIHALQIKDGTVTHADLNALAPGAPKVVPIGPPTHLVRGDGVVIVAYIDASGGLDAPHCAVNQLSLNAGTWVRSNLSQLAQSPIDGRAMTTGYVKPDQTTALLYVSPPALKELALAPGGTWTSTNLLSCSQAPPPSFIRWLTGFVRSDGIASVVYADTQNFLHELAFVGGRWLATALSETAKAPPVSTVAPQSGGGGPTGYVRGDGVTAVVYCGSDNHIHERALIAGQWVHTDLSLAANSTTTFGYPFAYVRGDRVSSVIYQGADTHIHELTLPSH